MIQSKQPNEIIVVDSSESVHTGLLENKAVRYIRSSHKNQPYQRFLGYSVAQSEWILFLDDDMEPVDNNVTKELISLPGEYSEAVGFAIGFEDLHNDTLLATMPKSKLGKGNGKVKSWMRWVSGYPILPKGKVGWNGVRGEQNRGGYTEWFSGGAFLAKRDALFKNFNYSLFTMFERKIGMGEDFILAYTLAQQGRVWATDKNFFYHNDQRDSTYTVDIESYNYRVIYSRLFLSLEKARLTERSKVIAVIHYVYYCFWRWCGLVLNFCISPSIRRFNAIQGFWKGFTKSFGLLNQDLDEHERYWQKEVELDMTSNGV